MQPQQDQTTDEIVKTTEDLLERSRRLLDDLDSKLREHADGASRRDRRSA